MTARRRPRELGLRRADGSTWPTRWRAGSLGVGRSSRRAQMAMGTSGARCSSAAAMVAAAGLCVTREKGRSGGFYSRAQVEAVRDGLVTPRHGMGAVWSGYGGAWAATCGGRRASGVRRHRRSAREGTARGSQGEGRKGRFGTKGSHRARTDGHWPVSTCEPRETTAARARHGAGTRDAGATARTGTFPIPAYPPLTNNYSNFCN
jgi:hypothetical protein